ncbi:hypothetical protein LMH87_010592 [Akanthomyces muscarius]|uniref:Uncharacterized protein n=1 Tax=Akanthomyces muscarius TaxID=2231603 RepID=A0A9W8QGY7_AKAMU|nr:hypothetical protein LMH87_010592 [Akanthomyces muscarius]KAJ4154129.1 hypothetical protein LMH87_010592 [Akanthomyces muscarius]
MLHSSLTIQLRHRHGIFVPCSLDTSTPANGNFQASRLTNAALPTFTGDLPLRDLCLPVLDFPSHASSSSVCNADSLPTLSLKSALNPSNLTPVKPQT